MKLKIDGVIKVYSKCATKQMMADHLLKKILQVTRETINPYHTG